MNTARIDRQIPHRTRRAVFLIELGLAMAISSVLLGIALVMLTALLRADPSATSGNATAQELDRFTDRLRHDLHRAQKVTTPQPTELHLESSGSQIIYELQNGQCLRRAFVGQQERTLPFAIDATKWILSGGEEPGQIVSVAFNLSPKNPSPSAAPRIVAAKLGKFAPPQASHPPER